MDDRILQEVWKEQGGAVLEVDPSLRVIFSESVITELVTEGFWIELVDTKELYVAAKFFWWAAAPRLVK